MLTKTPFFTALLASLPLLTAPLLADEVPAAMKVPVNANTVPADTTGRTMPSAPHADNSDANKIHNGKKAVSADQQGNSKEDVEITRKIRQALVKDDNLSVYAHNVKIISNQGRVVLKGPVRTNEEKAKVEESAFTVAGKDKVVSEIEVKN